MNIFGTTLVIVRAISMALWVGGMVGFAFIFAPAAFHSMGPTPSFAALIAQILRNLTVAGVICAVLAVAATLLLRNERRRFTIIFVAMVLAMSALSLYERASIIPRMEQTAVQTPAYAALHRASSDVYGIVLLIGVAAIALLSVRDVGKG
ncbi:MAG: DUF4149 domain-containing protein [Candidatus Baltobacteraceae bacterium]